MIWCDLEGLPKSVHSQMVIDHCNQWCQALRRTGFEPGLYVGWSNGLNAEQLYHDLKFRHYWKTQGHRQVAVQGYQMVQETGVELNGISIDHDLTQSDLLGDSFRGMSS